MRFEITKLFNIWFENNHNEIHSVAVLGGTSSDPELRMVIQRYPSIEIDFIGIENTNHDSTFIYSDLNKDIGSGFRTYDLVICSQVLEHLWNLEKCFDTFATLVTPGGFLWINCPASNIVHGSPAYYSAGYAPSYVSQNLLTRNFDVLLETSLGSKRYYFMTHILRFWATEREHEHPVLGYNFKPGTFLGITRKLIRDLPGRFLSLKYSKKITEDLTYATETLVLAKSRD